MKMNVDTINRNDVNPIIRSHRQKRKKKLVFPFSKIYTITKRETVFFLVVGKQIRFRVLIFSRKIK